jgi:GTP cyclohydrolase FolE2
MNDKAMKHYKEYYGFKVGDDVYILDYYDIKKTYIQDIFDDYEDCESRYICKFVKTPYGNRTIDNVYKNMRYAEDAVREKKRAYDRYVLNPR